MATGTSQNNTSSSNCDASDRLRRLYPAVDEDETPLPRYWSPKDKFNYIGLSQGNLRVHYKGWWSLLCICYLCCSWCAAVV